MKHVSQFVLATAVVSLCIACSKDKDTPEGPTDFSGGCEAVDLGLTTEDGKPLKWAAFNVGAKTEVEPGSFFAWGETGEKDNYACSKQGDYKWFDPETAGEYPLCGMTKYSGNVKNNKAEVVGDGLFVLQKEDDAATKVWGTKWRTPTLEEVQQLFDDTKCEWTFDTDRNGYVVKGIKTGNSIFLPLTGFRSGAELKYTDYCYYWASTVLEAEPNYAFGFAYGEWVKGSNYFQRHFGQAVRAVTEY